MADAEDLWTAVKASYDEAGLVTMTRRSNSATTIDDDIGEDAASSVLALWPMFAQIPYDGTVPAHVEIAKQGVIAILWRRGGASTTIEQVKWDTVFGDSGLIAKVRDVVARGRTAPVTDSRAVARGDLTPGRPRRPSWSESVPSGIYPDDFPTVDPDTFAP